VCINISDESVTITAPIVQLIKREMTTKQNTVDRGEIKKEASIKEETISIRRMFRFKIKFKTMVYKLRTQNQN
jgi:hypothetical protein